MENIIQKTIGTLFRRTLVRSQISSTIFRRTYVISKPPSQAESRALAIDKSEPEREIKWLFPASKESEDMAIAHLHGVGLIGGRMTLGAKQPINPKHFETALILLNRKIPSNYCCLKNRDGRLWVCEEPGTNIDFKVLDDVDPQHIIDKYLTEPIGHNNAPLWKARLIPVTENSPCVLPEIQEALPYQYDLLLSLHHGIWDGATTAFCVQKLVELLNEVIAGRPVNYEPCGIFAPGDDILEMNARIRRQLEEDPIKFEQLKEELEACDNYPGLLKAFPPPGGDHYPAVLPYRVNSEIFKKIYAQCKRKGVTFNSGLEAIINMALVEMVKEAGIDDESHQISVNLSVDLRRFKKRYNLPIVGLNRQHFSHRVQTNVNVRNDFWEYTRLLHDKLSKQISSGEMLQQYVAQQMNEPEISLHDYYNGKPPITRDYLLANIGDLTKVVPGMGEHVQLTKFQFLNGAIKSPYIMVHHVFTLRGVSFYTLFYDRSVMADDTAGQLTQRIMDALENFPK